jgi:hypothetical protein
MVQSPWYGDDQLGIYLKDFDVFLDGDGLEIMDTLKWWRVDDEPPKKMKAQAKKCADDLEELKNISITELAKEMNF